MISTAAMSLLPLLRRRRAGRSRAVLYLRVSTLDQTTANQERELRQVAERAGWQIVHVYKDHGVSGAKGRDKRPAFDALHKAAVRREFDVVMAWSMAPDIEKRISAALKARHDTGDSVRKIAARFGVDPSTVQRISRP
jgi:predicted site-specific integrase-resolvase